MEKLKIIECCYISKDECRIIIYGVDIAAAKEHKALIT
jgi:hypothetical protein